MKKIAMLVVVTIAIMNAGCATTANYEKVLTTWFGNHADNLVMAWGPPQNTYKLSDGSVVMEYMNSRNTQVGGFTYTAPQTTYHSGNTSLYGSGGYSHGTYSGYSTTNVTKQTPIHNVNLWCKTRFIANSKGIITRWSYEGNGCKSSAPK